VGERPTPRLHALTSIWARFTTDYRTEDLPAFQEHGIVVRRESRFHFEGRIRRPDGEVRWIELTGATEPVDEQASIRFIGTIQDITARKTAEERLHTLAADLSMADRRKNEFLATLAHELRNPLAPITNSIALLRLAAADPVLSGKALATMERQVGHMVRLIEDLLDLSRITNDKLELKRERVELAPIIRQAVETCRGDLAKAGHALTVSPASEPIILNADLLRLRRCSRTCSTTRKHYRRRHAQC
jgi:signal transduction histidine kinase